MPDHLAFFLASVQPMELLLRDHPLAGLFTGELFYDVDHKLTGLALPNFGENPVMLSPEQVGTLFMAPDESIVRILKLAEQADGSPAGFSVTSDHPFAEEPVEVIAYRSDDGNALQVSNLHIRKLMLDSAAPDRWCTIAFGLMAIMAYRLEFREITLYAAGRGPVTPDDPDEFVGYLVWPKFGFDAPLEPVDLQGAEHLQNCQTVQDVMEIDPDWWSRHGSGRAMSFDLRPNSRSWNILLNYLFAVLEG